MTQLISTNMATLLPYISSSQTASLITSTLAWSFDDWGGMAEWVDARLCLHRSGESFEVRPRTGAGCDGAPFCTYGFYRLSQPCTAEAYQRFMFQADRYAWMQQQARKLLAERPPELTAMHAPAWASWCREAMRVYSFARWATNVSSTYLGDGPTVRRVTAELLASLPAAPAGPENRHLLSMFLPRDMNDITRPDSPPVIPSRAADIDPLLQYQPPPRAWLQLGQAFQPIYVPWPTAFDVAGRSMLNRVSNGDLAHDMRAWFESTIARDVWLKTRLHATWPKAGPMGGTDERDVTFWYGGAKATIRLCIAYLEDVARTDFGVVVAQGLEAFLARLNALPPELQGMTLQSMGMTVGQAIAAVNEATQAAVGAVTGVVTGIATAAASAAAVPVVGWVVSIVMLVLAALISLMILFGGGFGGGELAAGCIPPPVIRMITQGEGAAPCDFDVRPDTDEARVLDAGLRVVAVADAARHSPEVATWYDASRRASGTSPVDLLVGADADQKSVPWLGLGVAGAVLLGGYFLLRRS